MKVITDFSKLKDYGFKYREETNVWYYFFNYGELWVKYNGKLILESYDMEIDEVLELIEKLKKAGIVQ